MTLLPPSPQHGFPVPFVTRSVRKSADPSVGLINQTDERYAHACSLADMLYQQKLGFKTLHHPTWALALTVGQTVVGSASAFFGNDRDLTVFQLGEQARLEMYVYLHTAGVQHTSQYAEITCFNVLPEYQRFKKPLLGYLFWYLSVLGTRATLNIQPIHLKRTAAHIGAQQRYFCKASLDSFTGTAAEKKALQTGYIQPLKPECVGVQPRHVTERFATNAALQMGVRPSVDLANILGATNTLVA